MQHPITPPPPHLLKKFSEQARVSSQKRGAPNYLKTFAILCIEWALQESAMNDLRVASAEVSGVELNFRPTPNDCQSRSSDITPPPELVQQWMQVNSAEYEQHIATSAAQWGADQQLAEDAKWLDHNALNEPHLRITPVGELLKEAMRPKPPSLKEQALSDLDEIGSHYIGPGTADRIKTIRRALENLPDD